MFIPKVIKTSFTVAITSAILFAFQNCGNGLDESENKLSTNFSTSSLSAMNVSGKRFYFEINGKRYSIPLFSNFEMSEISENPRVRNVVVAIHGSYHKAGLTYDAIVKACGDRCDSQSAAFDTMVVAPQFLGSEEVKTDYANENNLLSWDYGWKIGYLSQGSDRLSSFAAMDQIFKSLYSESSSLKITLTGHSAGGQFVSRYAALSKVPWNDVRFVIANPSSYLYLTSARPFPKENCSNYDKYRYGVSNVRQALAYVQEDFNESLFLSRDVQILIGENDTGDNGLDKGCGAYSQGSNRLERALRFYEIHKTRFAANRLKLQRVQGAGHSSYEMYGSQIGKSVLFRGQSIYGGADNTPNPNGGSRSDLDGRVFEADGLPWKIRNNNHCRLTSWNGIDKGSLASRPVWAQPLKYSNFCD